MEFFEQVKRLLAEVEDAERHVLKQGGEKIAEALLNGGIVHVFGTGHSHLIAEEVFCRSGGLAALNAMLEPSLMLHAGAFKTFALERMESYAEPLLKHYRLRQGDVLIVVSNSGITALPIELAIRAKEQGVWTIAITSVAYSKALESSHSSGRRLYEVVDLAIDNHGVIGDAIVELPGLEAPVGPTSTIVGAAIAHSLLIEAYKLILHEGVKPPVFLSSHLPNVEKYNMELKQKYVTRVKHF